MHSHILLLLELGRVLAELAADVAVHAADDFVPGRAMWEMVSVDSNAERERKKEREQLNRRADMKVDVYRCFSTFAMLLAMMSRAAAALLQFCAWKTHAVCAGSTRDRQKLSGRVA